jgi:hypothetical protein
LPSKAVRQALAEKHSLQAVAPPLEAPSLEAPSLEAPSLEAPSLEAPSLEEAAFPQPAASVHVEVPAPVSGVVARPRSRRASTWMWLGVGALALGAALVVTTRSGGFGQQRATAEPKPLVAPRAPAAATAKAAAFSSDMLARAADGDAGALTLLEAVPARERTAEQTLALAAGRAAERTTALGRLRTELGQDARLIDDHDYRVRVLDFARAPETARDALGLLASLPGSWSADLLYEVWTSTPGNSGVAELAEALLYSKDVVTKATPQLRVALDLRASKPDACEERKGLLDQAIDHGDQRSLYLIGRLLRRYGCGANRGADCNACLRGTDIVTDAMRAVRRRKSPRI